MKVTPTPTSGAADLPEALINIAREIEALKRDCGMDPESAIAIQNGRYMAISSEIRALAAGQATAAQPAAPQGVAYADLPTSSYAGRVYEEGFLVGACPLYTADDMHAFADATHALRASPGQAPAQPDQPIACSYGDNGYACCEGGPCQADVHNDKLAEQPAPAGAQADSVQEDAARYRWLRERSSTMFVNVSINGDGAEIAETLDSAVDAARKQGEKQ